MVAIPFHFIFWLRRNYSRNWSRIGMVCCDYIEVFIFIQY